MQEDVYCKVYVAGAPDISALKAVPFDTFLAALTRRLAALGDRGLRTVVSCDFEAELAARSTLKPDGDG